jgi:hypothetical protein
MACSITAHATGVEPADNGAHAGAGDCIDRHVQPVERLEHANVRGATCAAAGQHEPDARPVRSHRRGRRRAAVSVGRSRRGTAEQQRD